MLVLVSYDIADDRRRLKVSRVLEGYGERVQYSVFECDLRVKQYERLKEEMKELADDEEDSVRIYRLCRACTARVDIIGQGEVTTTPDLYIV